MGFFTNLAALLNSPAEEHSPLVGTNWLDKKLCDFEIGKKILTGIRLTQINTIANSPVKDEYKKAITKNNNHISRKSWD